jgi:hypothetical protein
MPSPSNVIALQRKTQPEAADAPTILGKLCREDFELWVCRSAGGTLSLKWWRWPAA